MNEQLKPSDTGRHVATVPAPQPQHTTVYSDIFANPEAFEHAQRVAKVFAGSKLVPAHLQGNFADCLIALQIARRLGEEPLSVMQNIFIVSGRPGWYTSYVIARANKAGVFSGRITWDTAGEGETLTVTAKAVLADTGEVVTAIADMKMARAEQWTKNAKYTSMPGHMLKWRSAAMLVRLYAPEVMLGMPVVEELETMPPPPRDITPKRKLSEALDTLAAGTLASAGSDEAEETDADTIDQTDPSTAPDSPPPAAGEPSPELNPVPPGRKGEGEPATDGLDIPKDLRRARKPAALAEPKTLGEYEPYAQAWIANLIDPETTRWVDEINTRNAIALPQEVRERLKAAFEAKVAQLRGVAS